MNGLLHRLAARATGTAVSLRSNTRLPYGGAALGWADTPVSEFAAGRDALRPVEQASLGGAGQPSGVDTAMLLPRTARTAAGAPSDELSPDLPLWVAHNPTAESEPAIAQLAEQPLLVRTEVVSVRDPGPAIPPLPEQPLPARNEVPSVRDGASSAATRSKPPAGHRERQRVESTPFEGHADAASRLARAPTDAAPLMPPAAGRSTLDPTLASPFRSAIGTAPPRAPWPQVAGRVADEATEVHIHIGRIDVTAVHEAPPPRRKQASTQAPMSLDAYLARRSRS
jgi:hypothetical protein